MSSYISFLADILDDYTDFMIVSQRWSKSYHENLHTFDRYLKEKYGSETNLTQEMVDSWCCQRPNESANSERARTNVIVALVKYVKRHGLAEVEMPDRPKAQKCTHIPHAFTEEELIRFFHTCDDITLTDHRKQSLARKLILCVIFRLMYSTGLRPNEARELKCENVNIEEGVLDIKQTKGHNQHYVALDDSTVKMLREYNRRMTDIYPDRAYFFPKGTDGHWSSGWLADNFRRLWRKANSNSHALVYDFRHNYAIENINSWDGCGSDFYDRLVILSKSMGHVNIEHTKYYYSITPQLYDVMIEKTSEDFNDTVPEVKTDEYW